MKNLLYKFGLLLTLVATVSACSIFEIDEVTNPNAADAAVVESGATKVQIQGLVNGLEARHKGYVAAVSRALGSFGRETLSYRDSDPRFTSDWLGRSGPPTPAFFAVGNIYNVPYQTIKQANFLMDAVENTDALTTAEKAGVRGFAKTIQAWQYLIPWLTQWNKGIRIDVSDPLKPGPRLGRDQALAEIRALLDEAMADLNSAGSTFAFTLTEGFTSPSNGGNFATPSGMLQLNRAIAAKAAFYAEDWAAVLTAVSASFVDNTNFDLGPEHTYNGTPDGFNPFFFPLDVFSTQMEVVHPVMIRDLLPGDARSAKFFQRVTNPVTNQALPGYTATHQDGRYTTNTDDVPFLRSEELILMRAEANAMLGNTAAAVADIDLIRTTHGLAAYAGGTSAAELEDEILFQRRYSLWFETVPHRWVDLRRKGRLSELEGDWSTTSGAFIATNETIFTQLEIPQSELNWDSFFGN